MFRRARTSEDFADEIEAHLALETERLVREGLPPMKRDLRRGGRSGT